MVQLRLYNTLTRSKEEFHPLDPARVRMYVCGPTVYDFAHIGNARPVIVFDVLYRLLRHLYGPDHVTYVRNITDVDDKINDRAARDFPGLPLNEAIRRVTETTASQYMADVKALGCLEPTHQPRATENIAQMIEIIQQLIARGHAYVAEGEVLFQVSTMADYGRLSRRALDEQQAGARVAVEAHKRAPADFVLWKLSSPTEPGWDSPWGRGRPGWHIECSAMSNRYLGETFDIHGGGLDLIFPHHENEIAQSRCAFGNDVMAKVWMHNGFLQVEGEKMSKSLGNFVTINELLATEKFGGHPWLGEDLRLAMLMTHYRQPIDWTVARLNETRRTRDHWRRLVQIALGDVDPGTDSPTPIFEDFWTKPVPSDGLLEALCDDLNTAAVFAHLSSLANITGPGKTRANLQLGQDMAFVGILSARTVSGLGASGGPVGGLSDEQTRHIGVLVSQRILARTNKNWTESDRIRDELVAMGIALKDAKDPVSGEMTTTWEVKR